MPRAAIPPIRRISRDESLPLSLGQDRFWDFVEQGGNRPRWHASHLVELSGQLDAGVLEQCVRHVVARHETLRTTFRIQDDKRAQIVHPTSDLAITVETADGMAGAVARAYQDAQVLFDLERGPLLRCCLIRIERDAHLLAITAHHIVTDAGSWSLFVHEIAAHYVAIALGQAPVLPALPVQYADFAAWQRSLVPLLADEHTAYWTRCLGQQSPVSLALDFPRPPLESAREARCSLALSPEQWAAVGQLSRDQRCSPFMTTFCAFAVILHMRSRQDRFVIGVPFSLRKQPEVMNLIGYFGNPFAIPVDFSNDPPLFEVMAAVRAECTGAFAHSQLPVSELPGLDPGLFYRVRFNFVPAWSPPEIPGLTLTRLPVRLGETPFDLSLYIVPDPGRPTVVMRYKAELFEQATIERMLLTFKNILRLAGDDPSIRLSELTRAASE